MECRSKKKQKLSKKLLFFVARKEVKIINYFFEIVVPQVLEYFKENSKDISSFLVLEALLKNEKYKTDIEKMFKNAEEISKKYK